MGWLFSETVSQNEPIFCTLLAYCQEKVVKVNFRTLILIFVTHSPVVAHYQLVFAESF